MKPNWTLKILILLDFRQLEHFTGIASSPMFWLALDKALSSLFQVVNVWEYKPKEKRVILKGPLYGHNEAVTCLAASPAYNVIVSGSRDRSCIIWDLNRLLLVRQLRGHAAPVAAVCVNELTVRTVALSLTPILLSFSLSPSFPASLHPFLSLPPSLHLPPPPSVSLSLSQCL